MEFGVPPPRAHRSRRCQQAPTQRDIDSALVDDETVDSAARVEKSNNMVADTRAATSNPPDQQESLPMGIEEMVRHLSNTVTHMEKQLRAIHERLDRQS